MDYPRYDPASPLTPLLDAELQALETLLHELPADGAMTLDGLDGFLTALLIAPSRPLATWPTADWLPWVWGGDGDAGPAAPAPFASQRQRKKAVVSVLRHLRHLQEVFDRAPERWEPILSIAEQGADEWTDARDWCAGFLQAVDLDPVAWGAAFADPALAPLLQLGGGLDGVPLPPTDDDLDDPAVCDRLSRGVPDAVLGLRARLAVTGAKGASAP